VTPGYLETIGAKLLRGRTITAQDQLPAQPVVVITKELARICWPEEEAIGRRMRRVSRLLPDAPWMTVVGVIEDVREDRTAFRRNRPVWYVPLAQTDIRRTLHLAVRSQVDSLQLSAAIRKEVLAMDPLQPISEPNLLSDQIGELVYPDRFATLVMLTFAIVGLFLAVSGTFGLVTYTTAQRTKEFAIRIAFGAQRSDIQRLVFHYGLRLGLLGVAVGVPGAIAASRVLSQFVFDADSLPLLVIAGVAVLLVAITLAACLIPARRALASDPLESLRHE
jgi:putative ABC transport system permease protein